MPAYSEKNGDMGTQVHQLSEKIGRRRRILKMRQPPGTDGIVAEEEESMKIVTLPK